MRTFKDTDGGGEVIDTASSPQGSRENLNGRDEVIGKAVVEISLCCSTNRGQLAS